jgi:hypothetical protein
MTACGSDAKTVADPTTASVSSVENSAEASTSTSPATTAVTEAVTTAPAAPAASGTDFADRICKAIKLAEGFADGGNADYYKVQFGIQLGQEFLDDALTSSPITDEAAVQKTCPDDYAAILSHAGAKSLVEVLQP